MKGLLLLAGKAKPKMGGSKPMMGDEAEPDGDEPSGSTDESYAREAFSALKDGDEDAWVQAFLGAVRACKGGGYEEE